MSIHRRRVKPIELVMLLVIVGLTALVFYPIWVRSRETDHPHQCLVNTKTQAYLLLMYSQDNDARYPYVGRYRGRDYSRWQTNRLYWQGAIDRYHHHPSLYRCDAVPTFYGASYAFNRRLSGRRLAEVSIPSQCVAVVDWVPYYLPGPTPRGRIAASDAQANHSTTYDIERTPSPGRRADGMRRREIYDALTRHDPGFGITLFGFVDGHVRAHRLNDIAPSPEGQPLQPDPKRPSFVP